MIRLPELHTRSGRSLQQPFLPHPISEGLLTHVPGHPNPHTSDLTTPCTKAAPWSPSYIGLCTRAVQCTTGKTGPARMLRVSELGILESRYREYILLVSKEECKVFQMLGQVGSSHSEKAMVRAKREPPKPKVWGQ